MLKYSLRENLLTPAPDDYLAPMADVRSVFENMRAITASSRKNKCSAYTQYACALFLLNSLFLPRLFSKRVTALCKYMRQIQGANKKHPQAYLMYVEDCFLCSNAVVAHRFPQEDGAANSFDKKRHTVNLNITAGTLLRDAATKIKCEKTEGASTDPYITEVADVVSGKVNEVLTKGGVVQLVGSRLKFDAKDAVQGIFFVPETGEAVRATVIAENKPARLMAIIPAGLKAGTYYIEVRTKISSSPKPLKNVKTGRFFKALTCNA